MCSLHRREYGVVIGPDFGYVPGSHSGRDEYHGNGSPMGQDIAATVGRQMKTIMALGVMLVTLGALMASPVMADPYLEGSIESPREGSRR